MTSRLLLTALLLGVMAPFTLAQAQPVKPAGAEIPAPTSPTGPKSVLDGVWVPSSIQYDGQEQMSATEKAQIRLSIENGEYKMFIMKDIAKGIGIRIATSSLSADSTKQTFNLVLSDGPRKGEKIHGIFELKDKTLKLAYISATKPLPTKFEAPKGSGVFNEVWTREK